MGKNPDFVLLVFLLCACIPIFVTCDTTQEFDDLENGLRSMKNIMVKYQAEFDATVTFEQLQEAIDVIYFDMDTYRGNTRNKLETIVTLNSQAHQYYISSLTPILEWCVDRNENFKIFISFINRNDLSSNDKKLILDLTVRTIDWSLNKTMISLKNLDSVQNRTAELAYQINFILHQERKELINNFLTSSLQKIEQKTEKVNDTVKVIKSALEEDKSNLIKLQKVIYANNDQLLFLENSELLQSRFASIVENLRNECNNYERWIENKVPFYRKN